MNEQRCPSCGGYVWNYGVCNFCGYAPKSVKPRFELAPIDLNKLHTTAIKSVMQKIKRSIPHLSKCLLCQQPSLFYNSIDDQFECLNPKCAIHYKPILVETKEYVDIINQLKLKHLITTIELTELEYDIYTNHLKRAGIHSEYYFEVILKY